MEWYIYAIILFSAILFFIAIGMPVAFALGLVSVLGITILVNVRSLYVLAALSWNFGTNLALMAAPLFLLMAEVIAFSGISGDLYSCAHKWLGFLPGSLAVGSVAACAVMAAVVGGSPQCCAAVGMIAVPEMIDRGYDKKLATGCVAAGGTLGILIPPSVPMIFFAMLTDQSIGKLFMAGVIPGIMVSLMFSIYIIVRVKMKPSLAPAVQGATWKEKFRSLRGIWPMLVLVFAVLGAIYGGICTPTEAAAIGAFGAIVISLVYRKLTWKNLRPALIRTTQLTAMIFFIIIGALGLGFLLTSLEIPQRLGMLMTSLPVNRWVIMAGIMLMYMVLGCFMNTLSMIGLTVPTIFPIVTALGFDPIWFGILLTINCEICNITPPVGMNLFVLKSVSPPEVEMGDIIRGIVPYVFILAAAIGVLMVFPQVALWLPSTMK